jgi:hypothetical protein
MTLGITALDFVERIDFAWLEPRLRQRPPAS